MVPTSMYMGEEYVYPDMYYPYDQSCARPFSSDSSCSSSNESDRMLAHQAGGGGYTPPATMLMTSAGHDDQHPAVAYQALTPVGTAVPIAAVGPHVIVDAQHYTVINEYVH